MCKNNSPAPLACIILVITLGRHSVSPTLHCGSDEAVIKNSMCVCVLFFFFRSLVLQNELKQKQKNY